MHDIFLKKASPAGCKSFSTESANTRHSGEGRNREIQYGRFNTGDLPGLWLKCAYPG
jgi:hypothetical protein